MATWACTQCSLHAFTDAYTKHPGAGEGWKLSAKQLPSWYRVSTDDSQPSHKDANGQESFPTIHKRALRLDDDKQAAEDELFETQPKIHKAGFKNINELIKALNDSREAHAEAARANAKENSELASHVAELEKKLLEQPNTADKVE